MKILTLKAGREKSLLRGHPWIYSGAVKCIAGEPETGETVKVVSERKDFLAYGAYAPGSVIPVKIWSFDENDVIDADFFAARLKKAFAYRKTVFNGELPDAYRLVNAESDLLPGLVADIYGSFCVCQITSAGMDRHRKIIAELLLEYAPDGVYERSDVDSRIRDGLPLRTGLLAGSEPPEVFSFTENGIRFFADPRQGHKTGFYLDQRISRKTVRDAAAGAKEVLNCFSYTGGFGLAALAGGAEHVLNIDASADALQTAKQNAAANGFGGERFAVQTADVFQFLRTCRDSRKTFDLIVLDPPKFAETMSQREKAARGYKDINLLAMKLLRPGGKLFTFSCSGAMDGDLFSKVIDSAAADAKCDFRIFARLSQGPDHPVSAAFPEGFYLKGIAGIKL